MVKETTSNLAGIKAHGGSIESDGPVVLDNNIFINSGYLYVVDWVGMFY